MSTENSLLKIRRKFLSQKKILCTGNPDRPYSLAYGIKKLYPETTFVHKSLGWDLTNIDQAFIDVVQNHNIFLNCSYIGPDVQKNLLDTVSQNWKFGHIISIGSSHEYTDNSEYAQSKRILQVQSLEMNNYRLRTSYIVLGGMQDGTTDHNHRLKTEQVADTIKWIIDSDFDIPLIYITHEKKPW